MFGFAIHEAPGPHLLQRRRPDEIFEKKELLLLVPNSLSELEPDELELILLKDVEGHSLNEISQKIGRASMLLSRSFTELVNM